MVTTGKLKYYQQDPAWTSPDVNHATTLLPPGHHRGVPANTTCFFPGLLYSKAADQNGVNFLSSLTPTKNEHPNDTKRFLPHLIGLHSQPSDASEKKFLICDHSGNQTRFFFSHGRLPENEVITPKEHAFGLYRENLTAVVEKRSLGNHVIKEKLDGSYLNGEESDTHEDTEEINALLYSSDGTEGDNDDDVYGEDDEVTSTDRSPYANQRGCEHELLSPELTEVASSYGGYKRQRLADGGYKKSSSIESGWADDDDVKSRCVKGSVRLSEKDTNSSVSTRERKVKIRETLRIIESLIPGIKSSDPLLVIDEAIDYLKSLKGKAKALGVGLPQVYSPASC